MTDTRASASVQTKAHDIQRQLEEKYPDLTVSATGSQIRIRGSFPVMHEGIVLERYEIEIEWTDSSTEAPILRETGGKIPRTSDRHIGQDGKACPLVPEEWLIRPPDARTIIDYLDGPAHDYFLWQVLVGQGMTPHWGQRSHDAAGLMEAYGEMTGLQGEKPIRGCLEYLAKKKVKGHWTCFCGSGRRLRDCHASHVRDLQLKIPRHIAQLALRRLANPLMR